MCTHTSNWNGMNTEQHNFYHKKDTQLIEFKWNCCCFLLCCCRLFVNVPEVLICIWFVYNFWMLLKYQFEARDDSVYVLLYFRWWVFHLMLMSTLTVYFTHTRTLSQNTFTETMWNTWRQRETLSGKNNEKVFHLCISKMLPVLKY